MIASKGQCTVYLSLLRCLPGPYAGRSLETAIASCSRSRDISLSNALASYPPQDKHWQRGSGEVGEDVSGNVRRWRRTISPPTQERALVPPGITGYFGSGPPSVNFFALSIPILLPLDFTNNSYKSAPKILIMFTAPRSSPGDDRRSCPCCDFVA